MAKLSRVVIYEVESTGSTGTKVGEGSLVDPELVFVHPPLSEGIACGCGPQRLRVGISSEADGTPFVAVADGLGDPVVIGKVEGIGSLVGLILNGGSGAPVDRLNGVQNTWTAEQLVRHAVPRLQYYSEDDWNDPASLTEKGSKFWCQFVKRLC